MISSAEPVIDVFELARAGATSAGQVALTRLPRLAQWLADTEGDLAYAATGWMEGGIAGANLHLLGALSLVCQRCGEPVAFELDRVTPFSFLRTEEEVANWPIEEDTPDAVLGSHAMPVLPWIEDEAILSLPLVPRHDQCVLPGGTAADRPPARAGAFAVLAGLRSRIGEESGAGEPSDEGSERD